MRDTGKILSLVIVAAMILTGFSAFIPLAGADIINDDDDRGININWTDVDDRPIFPGEENFNFWVEIDNDDMPSSPDVLDDTTDTIYACEMTISTTIRNENGMTVTTPFESFLDNTDPWGGSISQWNSHQFGPFQFDVRGDAVPGTYNLTVTLDYKNNSAAGSDFSFTSWILFDIEYRADIGNVGGLIPGDRNTNINVLLDANNDMPGDEGMVDPVLEITLPDGDFQWFGTTDAENSAMFPGTIDWHEAENFWYMVSVSAVKDSGTYTGTYELMYTTENGVDCIETGDIDFIVGQLAMLEVTVSVDTIEQGTSLVTWALTFENVGTVDLYGIKCQLDDDSDAFTYMPADHWEDDGTVSYAWLELGDIAIGDTTTASMEVGVDLYIPEGEHKVMFTFWGMYEDPDANIFMNTVVDWTMGAVEHIPRVNMGAGAFTLDPETSTVGGPFIWITVTDTTMDLMLTSQNTLSLGGRIVDNGLQLAVQNFGNIDFGNVVLQIETNSATSPFLNVIDPAADFSEEAMLGTLWAGSTEFVTLRVDLAPGVESGVHSVPVTITGVNMDMGAAMTTTLDARVTISGVGPKLEITTVSPGEIKNGADFTLTLTITNNGDDVARNVRLTMPNIGVAGETNEINGDIAAPIADALPIYIADLAPGESVEVEIEMKANKDMSSGHVYLMTFATAYTDSFGDFTSINHGVSLKSTGFGGSTVGMFYYAMIILILVASCFLIAYTAIMVKKYKKANPKGGAPVETETSFAPSSSYQSEPENQTPPPPTE